MFSLWVSSEQMLNKKITSDISDFYIAKAFACSCLMLVSYAVTLAHMLTIERLEYRQWAIDVTSDANSANTSLPNLRTASHERNEESITELSLVSLTHLRSAPIAIKFHKNSNSRDPIRECVRDVNQYICFATNS